MSTPSRRERKKQKTRQRLLERAWDLFQERGYDDTTVEDITEAADVAKGTFFNYFATKEAILDEIALWRIDLLGSHVLAADDVPEGAVDRIKRLVRAMADEFSPERELPQHLLIARISAPIRHESAHRLGSIMHDLVRQGQDGGEIRTDVDAGLIARFLLTGAFHYFRGFHHPTGNHSPNAHPDPPQGTAVRNTDRPQVDHGPRNTEYGTRKDRGSATQLASSLEARLIESIDALMDGLGGPSWRNS
jgi:AcrR family transcriptional regulator